MDKRFNGAALAIMLLIVLFFIQNYLSYSGASTEEIGDAQDITHGRYSPEFLDLPMSDPSEFYAMLNAATDEQTRQRAQPIADYSIHFKSGSFLPPKGLDASLEQLNPDEKRRVLLQLHSVLTSNELDEFAAKSVNLQHITGSTYSAFILREQMLELAKNPMVRAIFPIPLGAKISPHLREGEIGPWATDGNRVAIVTYFFADVQGSRRLETLRELGAEIVSEMPADNAIYAIVDREKIALLAGADEVPYLDQAPPPLEPGNDGVRRVSNVDQAQASPYNLDGTGVKPLIYDFGSVDQNHADLFGRVTIGEPPSGIPNHATHVAGTFGGSGILRGDRLYRGVATNAQIYSYIYENCRPNCLYNSPQDLESNYNTGINRDGVHLATNSLTANIAQNGYPCSWLGDYEATSQLLDRVIHQGLPAGQNLNQGLPILFAAGNERDPVVCGTAYGTMSVPATAKNIVSVGAIDSNDLSMTSFSSWGPTDDGRLKPDVVATGCDYGQPPQRYVTSTFPFNSYGPWCGTSMATPVVAGIIALLLQQYRNNYWQTSLPFTLRNKASNNARMKALLLHTARDLGSPGPDYQHGYGLADARAAVDQLRDYRSCIIEKQLDANTAPDEFIINAPSNQQGALKATLVWDDPPASPLAAVTLVNDLDLRIVSPSGSISIPLVLNPAQPAANAVPGNDNRNNAEQIQTQATEGGAWRVKVIPTSIPQGPQRYSLVITPTPGVLIVSFTGGAPVIGNQGFKIQVDDVASAGLPVILILHLGADSDILLADGRIIRVNPNLPYVLINGMLDGSGRAVFPAGLPNDPSFVGVTAYATAIVLDPTRSGTPQYIKGISCTVPMGFAA